MHISKDKRKSVYEHLFNEGVLVCVNDTTARSHMYIKSVPNLQVMHLMRSLVSKEFVTVTFSWDHYYYVLTDKGIEFLRSYLKLPINCIPGTFKKPEHPSQKFGSEKIPQSPLREEKDKAVKTA